MPYYLILAPDRPDALDDRLTRRQAHLDYWKTKQGSVKVAGAMLDGDRPCGSTFLIEARDEADARALLAEDPFTQHGVFLDDAKVISIRPAIGDWLPTA